MSIALMAYLKPLSPYLNDASVSEICVNNPGEIWLEKSGRFTCHAVPDLTQDHLRQLAGLVAEDNCKDLSDTKPLLSATLPAGERCQFVLPPACEKGRVICAIRKQSVLNLTLDDWETRGAFAHVKKSRAQAVHDLRARLNVLYKADRWKELIQLAVESKLNIIISGGTSTAKTSFLNSCLQAIPEHERLVTIEGVREVVITLPNKVHLLANEDEDHTLTASVLDLLKVSLRLRPDRIFVSELRAREAYPFLRACISGHPGSLTTLHADSIPHALEQLCFMLSEAPELQQAPVSRLREIIRSSVNMVIQMARLDDGNRVIDDICLYGDTHAVA
jgi:type IV secretion system protein VirB11